MGLRKFKKESLDAANCSEILTELEEIKIRTNFEGYRDKKERQKNVNKENNTGSSFFSLRNILMILLVVFSFAVYRYMSRPINTITPAEESLNLDPAQINTGQEKTPDDL